MFVFYKLSASKLLRSHKHDAKIKEKEEEKKGLMSRDCFEHQVLQMMK